MRSNLLTLSDDTEFLVFFPFLFMLIFDPTERCRANDDECGKFQESNGAVKIKIISMQFYIEK